jgi:NADPH:quinone reductase-like Zn-dependent oxidoreductase
MYAVQIAKNLYGAEVTGVCSYSKVDYVKSLGANKVIDYRKEDYRNNGLKYDIIFDTFGTATFKSIMSLTKKGTILYATYGLNQILQILWLSLFSSKKAKSPLLKEKDQDLNKIKNLIEKGIIMPYIDKKFPIEKASAAHDYFENGQKTGSVIITLN